jgi:hypothetical protein
MGTAYAIYDTEAANLVDTFPTEREALEMIRLAIKENGPESIEGWALGQTDHEGKVYTGQELVEYAMAVSV